MAASVQDNRQLSRLLPCLSIKISNDDNCILVELDIFRAGNEEDFGSPEKFSGVGRFQDPSRSTRGEMDGISIY